MLPSGGVAQLALLSSLDTPGGVERQASLTWDRVPTTSRSWALVDFYRHVLRQPVEHIGPMPADGFAAVCALLREASEDCEAEKQPARAAGQARDLARAEDRAQIW